MNHDQDLDRRVGRWLAAREVPVSGERVSNRILATLVTTRQERRPILRRGPITRPPLRLLAVAAALLVAGGLAAVIGLGGRPSLVFVPPPTPSAAPTSAPDPYPQVVRQIDLGADTWQVLATPTRSGFRSTTWASGKSIPPQVSRPPWSRADPGFSSRVDELWVQKGAELVLVRVDPQTGRELERFEGIPGFTIAKDGDTVWGFDENGNVVHVDIATGEVLASIDVPEQPKQIVLAADAVWVACDAGSALVRIDPETAVVTDTVDVGFGPVELELGFDSLWVRNREHELVRIDPETAEVIATIEGFGASPSLGLSFGGGHVWASASSPAGMAAIDPSTNAIAYEIPLPGVTFMDSYWIDGQLWVSTAFDQQLLQVDAASPSGRRPSQFEPTEVRPWFAMPRYLFPCERVDTKE